MFNCEPAMNNEINAYSQVLPVLKKFSCPDTQLPFANLFFAGSDDKGEMIVMEDLCQLGYEMEQRSNYLSMAHCVAVMKVNMNLGIYFNNENMKHQNADY